MSENKSMTIEIPAKMAEEIIKEARKLDRFSSLTDVEIVEAVLKAGVNKAQA